MSDVAVALEAIAFMEAHLSEEILVKDVADAVSLSLFHFSRTFSRTTRHPPYDYLMRRRLSTAAQALAQTDEKVIDVAFAYRFNAPETFSRAFRRMFGLQPRQVKAGRRIDPRLLMPRFTRPYLEFLSCTQMGSPVRTSLPSMTVAGVAAQIDDDAPGGATQGLWALLHREIAAAQMTKQDREFCAVMIYSPVRPAGQRFYLAGTVLQDGEVTPPTLLIKQLPEKAYGCFDLQAGDDVRYVRRYAYHTWWPKMAASPLPTIELERWEMDDSRPRSICLPLPVDPGADPA
jgi:AraC family transcriptional regulator